MVNFQHRTDKILTLNIQRPTFNVQLKTKPTELEVGY